MISSWIEPAARAADSWGWPQWAVLVFYLGQAAVLLAAAAGAPLSSAAPPPAGRPSWQEAAAFAALSAAGPLVLYLGGFFSPPPGALPSHWPQLAYASLFSFGLGADCLAFRGVYPPRPPLLARAAAAGAGFSILALGGFWAPAP